MHEVHLVLDIVERVEREAINRGAKRVTLVTIRYNPIINRSASHVLLYFNVIKKNVPIVRDAQLRLNRVDPLLQCRKCSHEFEAGRLDMPCPQCASAEVEPVNPVGLHLEGFDAEG